MAVIVVPFHAGKTRLAVDAAEREALAKAMLQDVLDACSAIAEPIVETSDGGQGAAVERALATLSEEPEPVLIVNADLPCLTPDDVRALLDAVPEDGLAVAPAPDGTTNALGLSRPGLFAALYGPGSAEEFRSHASQLGVPSSVLVRPGFQDDVDTPADLERIADRVGSHTRAALAGAAA
jgi:2-phospho-L-lactate guanylyltransferase (CobY/MobA/RfbA family)